MDDKIKLDAPLNVQERYMYSINVRLDVLIHQMNSLIEAFAQVHNLTSENNEVKQDVGEKSPTTFSNQLNNIWLGVSIHKIIKA